MATSMNMSNVRRSAKLLRPIRQEMVISQVEDMGAGVKCYTLRLASGAELTHFEAGCFIPVFVELGGNMIERLYAISSSPREAKTGIYKIIVKQTAGGYVSTHILENWKLGDKVTVGAPQLTEVHRHLRTGDEVVAIAGGVGIAPFHSMAKSLAEGDSDYTLTLFYGANTYSELLYQDEWAELEARAAGRLKVVPILANEEIEGCETGSVTLELIRRYANPEEAIFFICGPGSMVAAMRRELAPLNLPRRRLRFSFSGDSEWDRRESSDTIHQLTIRMGGEVHRIPAREDETILVALEKAGLEPAAYCRSSICGFCSSTVIEGSYILATDEDGVRTMDRRHGSIHVCCSYPTSDMELVVRRAKR